MTRWASRREQWEAAQRTLLVSPMAIIERVLPGMRERGFGRVVAIGSMAVSEPIDALQLSNAHRPGLVAAFKVLARQYAADGVTFNHVHPGRIATDRMIDTAGSLEEAEEHARETIPAGRLGTVEELAAAAVFLCSQPAAYINGTALLVDGARHPQRLTLDCGSRPHGVAVSTQPFHGCSTGSIPVGGTGGMRAAAAVQHRRRTLQQASTALLLPAAREYEHLREPLPIVAGRAPRDHRTVAVSGLVGPVPVRVEVLARRFLFRAGRRRRP